MKPIIYIAAASIKEKYNGISMVLPTSAPKEWNISVHKPPTPILIFILIEEIYNSIAIVTIFARIMIRSAAPKPAFSTTHPSRKYIITTIVVRTDGVKTFSNVPKCFGLLFIVTSLYLNRIIFLTMVCSIEQKNKYL